MEITRRQVVTSVIIGAVIVGGLRLTDNNEGPSKAISGIEVAANNKIFGTHNSLSSAQPSAPLPGKTSTGRASGSATSKNPSSSKTDTTSGASAKIKHVVWILEENKSYDQVMDKGNAPYLVSLSKRYGYVNKTMHAEVHPSLGNYLDLSTGTANGVHDDKGPDSHKIKSDNIWHQLGDNWTGLMQSMDQNCQLKNKGPYVVRHNPPAYMQAVGDRKHCEAQDVPLKDGETGDLSKALTIVTPDKDHDMHDGSIKQGDNFLKKYLGDPDDPADGTLFASDEWKSGETAVIITWDEDDGKKNGETQVIPTVVISADTKKVASTTDYYHYDITAATEEVLGLPILPGEKSGAGYVKADDGKTSEFAREFGLVGGK